MTKPHSLQDQGASSGPGARASHQAPAGLDHSASPPRAFTAGPWDYGWHQPSGDFTLHYGSDEHVGPSLLEGGLVLANDKENEANANLIAAAPELYEALEDALAEMRKRGIVNGGSDIVIAKGDAALAKARGQQ